jgi:hypothetical protein
MLASQTGFAVSVCESMVFVVAALVFLPLPGVQERHCIVP